MWRRRISCPANSQVQYTRVVNLMSDNTNNVSKLRRLPNEQKAAQLIVAALLPADVIVTLINLNNVDITREEQLARFAYNSDGGRQLLNCASRENCFM